MTMKNGLQAAESPCFYIFTSYLWTNEDNLQRSTGYGKHYHLALHRERLVASAQALGWSEVFDQLSDPAEFERFMHSVERHLKAQHDTGEIARKVKVSIYRDTNTKIESVIISLGSTTTLACPADLDKIIHPSLCAVTLDIEPIPPSLFTRHKTAGRSQYDRARIVAAISQKPPHMAEVLVFNPRNEVMECSMSTPYFRRNDRWVTPPLSSGGNAGVTRRVALESGQCKEEVVRVESLRHEETIWISNGVRGFVPAILRLNDACEQASLVSSLR